MNEKHIHDYDTGSLDVIVGVSRCRDCKHLATEDDHKESLRAATRLMREELSGRLEVIDVEPPAPIQIWTWHPTAQILIGFDSREMFENYTYGEPVSAAIERTRSNQCLTHLT